MQNKYYADNRDLVKWSVLIRLAEEYKLSRIIQVAYLLQDSKFDNIAIDGLKPEPPSPEVLLHFRNMRGISALHMEISISVFDQKFGKDNRGTYHNDLIQFLAALGDKPRLVFLDPDIGLQPLGRFDSRHVLCTEVHKIWSQLKTREVFAFYQHKPLFVPGTLWIEEYRTRLGKAIEVGKEAVLVGKSPIAMDVAIFFVVKP